MNNKDFINRIATELGITPKEVQQFVTALSEGMADNMDDESQLIIPGFGSFEIKKKMERITVNPATKQRKLVPPKLVMAFTQSNVLKEKIN